MPVPIPSDIVPDAVDALKAALVAERSARQQAEARASGAEAMVAHLKLIIAKLRRESFGPSAERGSQLLDQLELQLEELEASATEDELAAAGQDRTVVPSFTRRKPVRAPFPAHLPRERAVSRPRLPPRGLRCRSRWFLSWPIRSAPGLSPALPIPAAP